MKRLYHIGGEVSTLTSKKTAEAFAPTVLFFYSVLSDIYHVCHLVFLEVERFFHFERFKNVEVDNIGFFHNNNSVADSVFKQVYAVVAHFGCDNSVFCGGSAAALNVTEYCFSGLNAGLFLNAFCKVSDVGNAVVNAVFVVFAIIAKVTSNSAKKVN